jgi:hypothetical protein
MDFLPYRCPGAQGSTHLHRNAMVACTCGSPVDAEVGHEPAHARVRPRRVPARVRTRNRLRDRGREGEIEAKVDERMLIQYVDG